MSVVALIALAAVGIASILILVVVARLHAFVALLSTSLVVAVIAGIPLGEIADLIQTEMGGTLGYIAVVIGLGAMFGEILQRSGGANEIADRLLEISGDSRAPWSLAVTGLVVATPVFFDVALVVLLPLTANLARRSGRSLLFYAVPLLAGIAVAHSFIPPTPGPVAVAGLLGADLGWVIVLGLLAGVPATLVGGIWYGRFISDRVLIDVPESLGDRVRGADAKSPGRSTPGFRVAASLVALPLVLILLRSVSTVALPADDPVRGILSFVGHPFTALLITTVLSFHALGGRLGFSATEVRDIATKGLEPVGMIILVTGAGGVFGKVLFATGVGDALADWMAGSGLPLVVLAFLIAVVVRVAQGSATVSMVTAAGVVASIVEAGEYSAGQIAAVVIAIASGATVLSHVNDSGFWLVSRYLDMTERQTLKVWTIMETVVGLTGFLVVLLLSFFL